ncbi:NAD-dependent epimerase/dehydratase family protein [Butyrivibrio sp. WCD3002]|uniref:NAD-dependent epimerase/dehydratase family protein n=1 Tax=Butyrivibrio sp. WCD3002 TaxID=1280676 RepID=UPI0004261185|nr:NAD-dependent epimerase/dehydratase family protein [Butyrivibrio sp. WCD3002]
MSKRNKMYLVTGAAGFLGSTVCRKLVERNEKVRAFVLEGDKSAKYLPEEVEIAYGDLCNKDDLERFFETPEDMEVIVLHIASIVTVNPDYSQKVMDVNVGGTENIIEMCKEHKVSKLVYCSSTGAIPEEAKGTIRECEGSIPLDPERIKGCYSLSKAMATNVVLKAAKEGLNACVVHPSGILGPEDFTKLVSEESGCKQMKFFLPISVANLIAGVLEEKAKKTGEKPLMTTFSVYNLARNNRLDSSKASKDLGYTTRSYRETIRDEIRWLKETGKIA